MSEPVTALPTFTSISPESPKVALPEAINMEPNGDVLAVTEPDVALLLPVKKEIFPLSEPIAFVPAKEIDPPFVTPVPILIDTPPEL